MWRLPGEFEQHAATWMAWPCRESVWPDIAATHQAYAKVINAIAEGERLKLLVQPQHLGSAKKLCSQENVDFIAMALDDSWARDTLPLFVKQKNQLAAVNWGFNAWGEKFLPFDNDRALGFEVIRLLQQEKVLSVFEPGIIVEGGAIHSNGAGLLMTTKQALLNSNRNTSMTQKAMTESLSEFLGAKDIIWLELGLVEDADTDGHIDNVAFFASENRIVMQSFEPDDINYPNFANNLSQLKDYADVFLLQQAKAVHTNEKRLALSYANSYIANHAVIIPSFRQKTADSTVFTQYSALFPDREIIQIDALDIVIGGGGIHCITMQEPEVDV